MTVKDNDGTTLFNIPDVSRLGQAVFRQRLAQQGGYQLIGEIASVDELRKTRPLLEGAKIKLKSWHEGLKGWRSAAASLSAACRERKMTAASTLLEKAFTGVVW